MRLQLIMTLTFFQTVHGIDSPIGRKFRQHWRKRRRTWLLTSIFLLFPKCSYHISHKWNKVNGLNLKADGMMECALKCIRQTMLHVCN